MHPTIMHTDSRMTMLQEAGRLTRVGAAHLSCRDGTKAMKAFKSAIVLVRDLSAEAESSSQQPCHQQGSQQEQCYTAMQIPGLEDSFYIYNHALLFEAASSSLADLQTVTAILLFNIALCCHQRGREKGGCDETKLRQAIHMYELSIGLMTDSTPWSQALIMVALNNQAQIQYCELCEYDVARENLDAICTLSPAFEPDAPSRAFEQRHFEEIFLNVIFSELSPSVAPSA